MKSVAESADFCPHCGSKEGDWVKAVTWGDLWGGLLGGLGGLFGLFLLALPLLWIAIPIRAFIRSRSST